MRAFSRAFRVHRPHEREYIAELVSIRKEIEFLLDFMEESPSNRTLYPVVEDFMEKEMLIERALRRSTLPPLPDELRNPLTRPRTPAEKEYIRQLIKKHSGKRAKPVPVE
jgi:hypothetical protein